MRVCLATSGNLASNPRLVKEALVLQEQGYSVSIVAADIIPSLSPFDVSLTEKLKCEYIQIPWRRPVPVRLWRALRQRTYRLIASCFAYVPLAFASRAHHALTPALTKAASAKAADLYIAHNLAALPAAAAAAKKHGGKLGFDAEDYHCGELADTTDNALELRIRRSIEAGLLPKCDYLTSASPQISSAYASDYGTKMRSILNVFPLADAPIQPRSPLRTSGEAPSLYWFSQTVGPGRGLEQIVCAMALLRSKVRLVLRGHPSAGYTRQLLEYARINGGDELLSRIDFLRVAPPNEMVRLSAVHDIGLAVEIPNTVNRDICLTNKAFAYLLAGVPVLLSCTTAQSQLAGELGAAALLADINDAAGLAESLDAYLKDHERQKEARAEAWRLGRERFNWDIEQTQFLDAVRRTI